MDKNTAMREVAETGRLLLKAELVARTWGNFSARTDETHFCITPSGLGYEHMRPEDTVIYCVTDGTYEGTRKPSSEKRIHAAAYTLFPEVGFVIHTHQTYATALGLSTSDCLNVSEKEKEWLGGLAWAKYGLPGTKALAETVINALKTGAHTVFMAHHGALICGKDREEAMARAELLENICRKSCRGGEEIPQPPEPEALLKEIKKVYPTALREHSAAVLSWAKLGTPLEASLDDMAQMIGRHIPAAKDKEEAMRLLKKHSAVFLPGAGCLVRGEEEDDSAALCLLVRKAAVAALHCRALGTDARLGAKDCFLMRNFYLFKYSKKKKG